MKYTSILFAILMLGAVAFAQKPTSGKPAPSVFAKTIDGKTIAAGDLAGKVVVLNMWFVNCPNCVEEIKLLNEIVDEYKDNKDVMFIGLATNNTKELTPFLKKNPFKYQIVPDATNIIFGKFGTFDKNGKIDFPFPQHFVVGRDGKILMKMIGTKGVAGVRAELKKQFPAK